MEWRSVPNGRRCAVEGGADGIGRCCRTELCDRLDFARVLVGHGRRRAAFELGGRGEHSQESAETQATKANQASAIDIPQGGGPAENTVDASREQALPSASSEGEAAAPSAPAEPVPGSEPEAAPPATPSEEEPVAQTVSVAVDGTVVGAGVFFDDKITYREGMTAYDALVETGVSYNATTSAFGMYVTAIAGLAEKDHGPQSGWKYSVNGAVPQTSASSYVLQPGDVVRWFYATAA